MKIIETKIKGAFLLRPKILNDDRGYFFEGWTEKAFNEIGENVNFVQSNTSYSKQNTLRGLHYQAGEHAQGKLVWVTAGTVFDVFVDLRKNSPTYGEWDGYFLYGDSHDRLWIPSGCAHGFLVYSKDAMFHYNCTKPYNKDSGRSLLWKDPTLKIKWSYWLTDDNSQEPILSEKDKMAKTFEDCEKYEKSN
jgi:dTDP-4-dehydrorhamnose 3,5-epimerase